jgi:Cytochrome c
MSEQPSVKMGEKVLFLVTAIFIGLAVVAFGIMEYIRHHTDHKMFPVYADYHFSAEGKHGMDDFFRKGNCTDCHRALNDGTNMGPGANLDGEGSRHDLTWIYNFLRLPEKTYDGPTLDHGVGKAAAYVANMPDKELHAMAVWLSELKVARGSVVSPDAPKGRNKFIDSMVSHFAPNSWKDGQYKDMRKPGSGSK